jgi:Ca-activated chloride channel family protein
MLSEFHWIRPEWFLAIPVIAALIVLLLRKRLGAGNWQQIIDPQLLPYVLTEKLAGRVDHRWWLMALGGLLAIVALAGPSWERIEQPVFRSDQALVIALDLSRSMDSQDVPPSRLVRAKLKVLDILRRREGGQTALIVYSANAFTVTPLTTDSDTIAALINSLGTDIMPSRGSYPVAAINKGRALLEQAGARNGDVLLITDGGSSVAAEKAAARLNEAGYTLSILGVGTPQGAPIPQPGGGFVTDRSGKIVVPGVEATSLRDLAAAGYGRFAMLTSDESDLDQLFSGQVTLSAEAAESMATDQWREEGPWLLLLLLPLAASAFRRGWLLVLVVTIAPLTLPSTAHALSWQDLWLTPDQQGQALLEQGDPAAAAATFRDPAWRAVSRYRAKDYAASASLFAGLEDVESLYNLGNALARKGDFETAIRAYDEVLERSPEHEDARYNRDLLQQLLEQQQQEQQSGDENSESQEDQDSEQGEQSQQQSGSDSQSESGEDGEQQGQSEAGEEEQRQEDMEAMQRELEKAAQEAAMNDAEPRSAEEIAAKREELEKQQAMEQWLRRIPNDPGGLLRRKFRLQYERQGRDQDGNNLWPDDEENPW